VNLSSGKRPDPPVFIEPLQDCCVDEGNDFTLRGVLTGSQPITVWWLHNGEVARFGNPSFDGREMRFVVRECLPEDAGAYTCLAENSAGKTSCCAAVFVRDFETIRSVQNCVSNVPTSASKSSLENGTSPQSPKDELQKFRGSICTSPTGSDQFSPVSTPREVIPKKRANSGTERPQPPASCPVISLVSATSLVLSWSGPCYDGGSAVLGYVVEVKSQGCVEPGDWRELTAQCKSTSYRVSSGLQHQQEYWFRVRAYNAVGVSEPGPVSPVVKMEQQDKPQEEDPQAFCCVSIDSSQKVTDHYVLQEKLGMGKFGLVFKLVHKETGRVCAGKFYKGRRAKEREAARKEIELMNFLHHPKLVQCLAAYDHKPEMVMVMEFIAGGELFERIVDDSFEHTEPASVRYMQQILKGIAFMHQQRIVHLDLKPENIVCVDTHGTSIKIIDFGLASKLDENTPLKVMHGTPEFVAPEVINYEPVFLTTDILSGESPFQGNSDAETLALVTAAQWEFDEESFDEITDEAKNFISSLLNKDARRRMTSEEALAHQWMTYDSKALATTKSLSKDKMKRFLARQKWKKTGKALLALKRMAQLSKSDISVSPTSPAEDLPLSPEAEHALQSLERKMQGPPQFIQGLEDQTVAPGSSARLSCHLTGYPDPEVVWLCGKEPVMESPTVQIEYEEDGRCTLVLAKVGPEDTNVYTCTATNDHGEECCSAKLIVQE
ncbi:hypothetical protein FQN60_004032, partial [Etheostoma spectabile]